MHTEHVYGVGSLSVSPVCGQGLLYDICPRVQDPLAFAVSGNCLCQHGGRKTPATFGYVTLHIYEYM